jgi:tRNA threonylcarbamoyladenosine biosynthesis protein TsaB
VLVLALDTSSPRIVAAVAQPGDRPGETGTIHGESALAPNRHGEMLAPLIERVLDLAAVEPSDLGAIGVGLGPGPFTGLRVGVVTAKTMGDALGIPTYGVCSLDVIAHAHPLGGGPFAVVTDARRKQVYWRTYDATGKPVGPPEISPPADVADALRGEIHTVLGSGVELYPDVLTGQVAFPNASDLAEMVMARAVARAPSEDLVPMYLRRPDARPPGRPKQVTPA